MTSNVLSLSYAFASRERPRRFHTPLENHLNHALAQLPDAGRVSSFFRLKCIAVLAARQESRAIQAIKSNAAAAGREAGSMLRRNPRSLRAAARLLAICRAASEATLGLRPYDVQIRGAAGLLDGRLVEMETGEGKTLAAALAAAAAALSGHFVHVITVNDYLAKRDAEELRAFFEILGLSVGLILHDKTPEARRAAYAADIVYVTNKELTFDYLRDQMRRQTWPNEACRRLGRLAHEGECDSTVMRGLEFAIVDEADSILVDEARTPLIISGSGDKDLESAVAREALEIARSLIETEAFKVNRLGRSIELTEVGHRAIIEAPWPRNAMIEENTRLELAHKALTALHLFERDVHYLVHDGKVQIIDEYTGRVMEDRFWNEGLHQMVELKESLAVSDMRHSLARITYQRLFVRYHRLSGMSGTLRECRRELREVYGLKVSRIPTHRSSRRSFATPCLYPASSAKWAGVASLARDIADQGRAVLIGTRTVAASRLASAALADAKVAHVVLNAAQDANEAEIISDAGRAGRVTVATNMAGRGTDIRLSPDVAANGGLAVILTERHEASRIDRQLAGRCGRQGDRGSVHYLLSYDDMLLELFRSNRQGRFLLRLSRASRTLGLFLIRIAQRHSENLHYKVRKQLLKVEDRLVRALAFAGPTE